MNHIAKFPCTVCALFVVAVMTCAYAGMTGAIPLFVAIIGCITLAAVFIDTTSAMEHAVKAKQHRNTFTR